MSDGRTVPLGSALQLRRPGEALVHCFLAGPLRFPAAPVSRAAMPGPSVLESHRTCPERGRADSIRGVGLGPPSRASIDAALYEPTFSRAGSYPCRSSDWPVWNPVANGEGIQHVLNMRPRYSCIAKCAKFADAPWARIWPRRRLDANCPQRAGCQARSQSLRRLG